MRRVRDYGGVADICRAARIRNKVTQVELEQKTGFSSQLISQFENGRNDNCMIFLCYLEYLTEEDKKLIMEEVYNQNAYACRRSGYGRGGYQSID